MFALAKKEKNETTSVWTFSVAVGGNFSSVFLFVEVFSRGYIANLLRRYYVTGIIISFFFELLIIGDSHGSQPFEGSVENETEREVHRCR